MTKKTRPYPHDENVEEAVETSTLELRLAAVHHKLGVSAGEDDDAVAPTSVAQDAATKQHLLVVDR